MIKREEIIVEIEELCNLHGNSICDFRKCTEFNSRLSALLQRVEEIGCYKISDRLMDALLYCSPKTCTHCKNAYHIKGDVRENKR